MLWNLSAVSVYGNLTCIISVCTFFTANTVSAFIIYCVVIIIAGTTISLIRQICNIIPYSEYYPVCNQPLIYQIKHKQVRHLTHNKLCLLIIIRLLKHLS